MGSAVEKDTTLESPSGVLDVPQQTINDSTVTTEARTAAKRRHDELEERQNELGSSQAEERNVRRKEGPSTPHKPAKTLPHEGNGQTQSPDHLSSEPDSPCSFRTAHSNSDHGPMSPTLEQNMDVDTENASPQPAYSPPEDSREQNIAQTLSNLADTIRHPSSSSSHPHENASSSHQLQDGAPEQQLPQTSQTVVSGAGADPSGPSANGPRITRSFLAAAAAAAREAEGLAGAQGSNGAPAAIHSTGFESLAQAINAAQQPLLPSEATSNNSAASQPTQSTSKPSGPAPLQVNANVSPNATVPTNGTEATQTSSLPVNPVVRVAEAAVAAQKAAASSSQSVTPASSSPPPPSASTTTETSPSQTGPSASPQTTSNPALASNPYAITTQYLKSPTATPTSPGLPMSPLAMNPYAMYYGPGTPTTPGYSPYMSPYYYMGAPMPSPNGVYPPGPSLPPTPASASAPPGGPSQQLPPPQRQGSGSDVRVAKPKRLKAHTVTSKSFSIPMVPRDKHGNPMLPLNVGIMTVHSLGSVCMREHFHTERYIFPVGYDVTRRYLSTIDPTHEVVYHCTILDGGDGPKFQIIPSDVPDRPVIAGTATGAWSSIVKQANMIRNRQHSNSVSGPDFFGLGQNTIKHLIQELPNARNLRDYVWQNFQEGGPLGGRHAAVIPALPEEYDGGLAVGNYYQGKLKRDVTSTPDSPKGLGYYPQHVQAEARRLQPSPPQPPVAGPSQIAPQPSNGNGQPPVSPPHQQPLQIHAHSMAEIAQALSNQAQAQAQAQAVAVASQQQQQQPPLDARQTMQYSNARSQPPVNAPYNPDPGIPPGGNPTGQGVPNTFASIMNAFPAGVPPAGVPPTQP